jgi:hypothetical protein
MKDQRLGSPARRMLFDDPRRGDREGEGPLAKVTPFHSKAPNAPKRYHDNPACPEGNKMEPKYKVPGTGGYQQCPQCARL